MGDEIDIIKIYRYLILSGLIILYLKISEQASMKSDQEQVHLIIIYIHLGYNIIIFECMYSFSNQMTRLIL